MGVLLLNSLIKGFVPTNFREMACVTQLDVRPESSLWGTGPPFELSLAFGKALAVRITLPWRTTREVSGAVHLHQFNVQKRF